MERRNARWNRDWQRLRILGTEEPKRSNEWKWKERCNVIESSSRVKFETRDKSVVYALESQENISVIFG